MATSLNDVLDQMASDSVDPRFKDKVERMKDRMSDDEIARWLFDRGALPDELRKQYRLDRVFSNVSSVSEIPEEAPPEAGDVNTARDFGLDPSQPPSSQPAEDEDVDYVDDYNDMTVAKLNAEIERRNDGRDEDDMIVPDSERKADLVSALEADDEA